MLLTDTSNTTIVRLDEASACMIMEMKKMDQPLIELRNGKVFLRQKGLSFEKMSETMQEIVKFRQFLDGCSEVGNLPLLTFPDEHLPLIAKLVHESDKTLSSLAKQIKSALQPEEANAIERIGVELPNQNDKLALTTFESAILSVAERVNYGIDWFEKNFTYLSVWRWEVRKEKRCWLPQNCQEKAEARIAERRQAKENLRSIVDALPQSEKETLQKGIKRNKSDEINTVNASASPLLAISIDGHSENKGPLSHGNEPEAQKSPGLPKKVTDPKRLAKEKERAEKKAARTEKERKEKEAQNKSRSLMSAFFSKPKLSVNKPFENEKQAVISLKHDPSSPKSDFEKTFKPFVAKKGAVVAPINCFKRNKNREVIVIDDDQNAIVANPRTSIDNIDQSPSSLTPQKLLDQFLASVSHRKRDIKSASMQRRSSFKSQSTYCVRDVVSQLSEAEIVGDISTVRRLQSLLKSRRQIPVKVLIFHEDTRPGYFGTFTKSSIVIGPRCPFARDAVVFDYSYDSGEEWEEEEGGDDVASQDGSEEAPSDADSDMDDWLVDDDVEGVDPGTPVSEREVSPLRPPSGIEKAANKRKSISGLDKGRKKRKVMPLVAFIKGPCWEDVIGKCEYEPFKQHRIQLFNDTPFPIDPFKFVSASIPERNESAGMFVSPALPAATSENTSLHATGDATFSSIPASSSAQQVKRKSTMTSTPKSPFPDALLPYLVEKVTKLATGNLVWLIESLYQDMKVHKIKKNSIEAKMREVAEKCPSKRIWVIKDEVLRTLGRTSISLSTCT